MTDLGYFFELLLMLLDMLYHYNLVCAAFILLIIPFYPFSLLSWLLYQDPFLLFCYQVIFHNRQVYFFCLWFYSVLTPKNIITHKQYTEMLLKLCYCRPVLAGIMPLYYPKNYIILFVKSLFSE